MPALEGMRVLDVTQFESGTACTQTLAWLGADVVKVESPRGDPLRGTTPPAGASWVDTEYLFLSWNSNKRSVIIDLAQAKGRELLMRMLPRYDVFVENYGPGIAEKLGVTYEIMREVHPNLIHASIKGFGNSGPYATYKAFDSVAQAASGGFSVNGLPDGPPLRPAVTIADSGTGLQAALAITAAYCQRQRTGEGQQIELSMQEGATFFMRSSIASTGEEATARRGNGEDPHGNVYPCKPGGPNDYVYLLMPRERMWAALCKAMGRSDLLDDARFSDRTARTQHAGALYQEIASWTRDRTKREVMKALGEAGVPASAVFDTADLFEDPHLRERGFLHTLDYPGRGAVTLLGSPARMSRSHVPLRVAPLLGADTSDVLREDLGLSDSELRVLRDAGLTVENETPGLEPQL